LSIELVIVDCRLKRQLVIGDCGLRIANCELRIFRSANTDELIKTAISQSPQSESTAIYSQIYGGFGWSGNCEVARRESQGASAAAADCRLSATRHSFLRITAGASRGVEHQAPTARFGWQHG
jgi:hypothetical protein